MSTATDDDTDEDVQSPLSTVSRSDASLQAPSVTSAGRQWGENYLKEHPDGVDTTGEASVFQDFEANADQARQALRQAREKLAAQRLDPSVLGFRVAQAMMAPSRYAGGMSNQISNAMGAIADWREQNQQFQAKQDAEDQGYAQQLSGLDQSTLAARLKLQELKEQNDARTLDTALKATVQPDKTQTKDNVQWLDAGDSLVPVSHTTGQRVPGLSPIPKAAKPGQAPGQVDDQTMDYLYQYWNSNHALPSGYSRNPAMVNTIMGAIATRAAQEGKTDAQILANSQLLKSQQKAENDFAPGGKLGQALTSTNRVVSHLADYRDLFNGLSNGDTQALNAAKNQVKTWLGSEAPTDIQAVAPILGDELTKSIVPGGGGVTERQEFAHNFSTAKSPEQAAGVINTYMKFLKDQVDGTKFTYEQLPSKPTDFTNRFLTPRTRQVLGYPEPAATTLPEAARSKLQEGYTTTFANGQRWTLQGGQPVQVQ